MITVRRAEEKDVPAIIAICSAGWRETYKDLVPQSYIEDVIAEWYNLDKVTADVAENSPYYHGYWVAEDDDRILGCIGGGIDDQKAGHVYVFYVEPTAKRQGIGTALLKTITTYQKETYAITEQWITSAMEGNTIGLSFYEKQGFTLDFVTSDKKAPHLPKSLHLKRSV